MFIEVFVDSNEVIVEKSIQEGFGSDMVSPITTRAIKIKGKALVDVRPETYDDRYSGRFDINEKYDVVIHLRSRYLGEQGEEKLMLKFSDGISK